MENLERYKHLNKYLKDKFGERTLKICIDGGFSCPNRDGSISNGGCIFCSERGSGDHIKFCSNSHTIENFISDQVKNYFTTYKAERAYFQNFTNTYDSISNLKLKYDSALIDNRIVALAVATRPDCINEDICKLLKSYCNKYYVWVELGLQTSNDETGKLINRGYSSQQFSKAVDLLNKYNIDVVTHIMVGLPNESLDDIKNTIDFINNHNIQGLKIHCTYVVENTVLASMYYNPNIVIHRVSGDAPKDLLVAPDWNSHKKWIMNGLDKYLRENDLWQGKYYI
jgi:radical SAM protein (TIGR01212 family)